MRLDSKLIRLLRVGAGRIATIARFAINGLWAIPAVLLIRLLRRRVLVRMGLLESARIGHFIADSTILLIYQELQVERPRRIDLFWFPVPTCNDQWTRMVRRKLIVRWWVEYLIGFNKMIPGGAAHVVPNPTDSLSRDIYRVLQQSSVRFESTEEEDEIAKAWFRRRGWRDGERFVCLAVRDSAYLNLDPLHSTTRADRWNYHDYRDSDIDLYADAAQELIARGYWVIRMGTIMRKPFPLKHPKVIDYPFLEDRDDAVDIWLSANCHFFVSSGTGIDTVPAVYGKRIVFVNSLPLNLVFASIDQIWVPKHLRWAESGRFLTLREHCANGFSRTEDYKRAGIMIEELSPSEITAAVTECDDRLAGTWQDTEADLARQRRFWETLRAWPDYELFHGYMHPEARVGCAWLRSMGDEFFA